MFALPDIPYTPAPYSQKRLTKSNERSVRWLTDFVKQRRDDGPAPQSAIFVHLLGGGIVAAREAFSQSLLEPLDGRDATALPDLSDIDEIISGYVLDLVPIPPRIPTSFTHTPSFPHPHASSPSESGWAVRDETPPRGRACGVRTKF